MSAHHLTVDELYSLEEYAKLRGEFRARVLEHKQHRKVALGDHLTLLFEDRLTIQYQVQEMLRVERIFEEDAILEELGAYNPLIPDGSNWKATLLIEYSDESARRAALRELVGIEDRIWAAVGEDFRVTAIADEDLERATPDKTSAVHFMRFELPAPMVAALKEGGPLEFGVDHPAYCERVAVEETTRESLIADLD